MNNLSIQSMPYNYIFTRSPELKEGICSFSHTDFYWMIDIPREKLRKVTDFIPEMSILDACKKANLSPQYLSSYYRSDFIHFLPFRPENSFTILDFGSGFGNITIPLAKYMPNAHIYAADASLDILKCLAARAKKEGCENITPCHVDIAEKRNLPFQEGSLDLIILNGVLEWIGAGKNEGDPRDMQISVLAYLKRFLKPNGVIYIGIEGRFFAGNFINVKDPHTRRMYTSIVPRFFADRMMKKAGHAEGYRTYTYSHFGYNKLFVEAGFAKENIKTIYPIASYKDPYFLFRYDHLNAYQYAFKYLHKNIFPTFRGNILFRTLRIMGLEKFFAPSYLFLIGNASEMPQMYVEYITHEALGDEAQVLEPIKILGNISDTASVSFLLINKNTRAPKYSIKIPRCRAVKDPIEKGIPESVRIFLNMPVYDKDGVQVFPFIPSTTIKKEKLLVKTAELLKQMHAAGKIEADRGFVHGDATLENVIFDAKGKLLFIDLDDVSKKGIQSYDLASLIVHYGSYIKKFSAETFWKELRQHEIHEAITAYDDKLQQTIAETIRDFLEKELVSASIRPGKQARYEELLKSYANRERLFKK